MRGVIFKYREIDIWDKIEKEAENETTQHNLTPQENMRMYELKSILKTIKSYKPSPNGNGMKWSKEEKETFNKLSYKEQRKMIVRKSELKSALFPYVNVDYKQYKYDDRISDVAKRAYKKAKNLLEANKNRDFNNMAKKIRDEIFFNLRLAYKEQYIKAGVELSALLFKHFRLSIENKETTSLINECATIVKQLMDKNIGEINYMYYQLYKWSSDTDRMFYLSITPDTLKLNKEQARECYNHALESIVWEAIDEEAQRKSIQRTIFAAELWLAAGIKYQSPLAFYNAGSNYGPQGVRTSAYALIMYHACMRCSIALGYVNAIQKLASDYTEGLFMQHASRLRANAMWSYVKKNSKQRGLINGLDPYFDEKFSPDLIIDLSAMVDGCVYGGSANSPGLVFARERGVIKDPRDKDSTLESIKKYYLVMWEIIVNRSKMYTYKGVTSYNILSNKIYQNLQYGLPSARPYIFPKEVLDLKIDF